MKDMESVTRYPGSEDTFGDPDLEEEPLSVMDFGNFWVTAYI